MGSSLFWFLYTMVNICMKVSSAGNELENLLYLLFNCVFRALTQRGGSNPVNHAMTSFNHVRLPRTALLGSTEAPKDPRSAFFFNISRVITGTLCMGAFGVSAMGVASCIGARYSLRRQVMDPSTGSPKPIISFSTQFIPVLSAIARSLVFIEFGDYARALFVSETDPAVRHCVAAIFKATVVKHTNDITLTLGDRCGAQGLFAVNQLSSLHVSDLYSAYVCRQ